MEKKQHLKILQAMWGVTDSVAHKASHVGPLFATPLPICSTRAAVFCPNIVLC